jgi:hypothetical protein
MTFAGQSGADLLGAVDRAAAVHDDAIAGPRERLCGRRADTPGRAGDEYSSGQLVLLG